MPRDNEKIVELLHDAQGYHKTLLMRLIEADASPETLRSIVDAMERISYSLAGDSCNPRLVMQTEPRFHITDDIESMAMKLTHLIGEAREMEK